MKMKLNQADIDAIKQRCVKEGPITTANLLGVTWPTLQRALRGVPIRADTYYRMAENADRVAETTDPKPVKGQLTQDEVEQISSALDRTTRSQVIGLLGITGPTLDRARYPGAILSSETLRRIRAALPRLAEIPDRQQNFVSALAAARATATIEAPPICPHCDGRTFPEALAHWLRAAENRRICRVLLTEAGKKREKKQRNPQRF